MYSVDEENSWEDFLNRQLMFTRIGHFKRILLKYILRYICI